MTDSIDIFSAASMSGDGIVRRRGIGLIDGSISGYALLLGDDGYDPEKLDTQIMWS